MTFGASELISECQKWPNLTKIVVFTPSGSSNVQKETVLIL